MTISSAGIGSGLDVASIVSQLVAAERAPVESRLDRNERQLDAEISALGTLSSAFDSLRSAVETLASDESAQARKTSVPDDAGFTAAATAGASIGRYQVEVLALAGAHKLSSAAYTDSAAAVGTGTLTIVSDQTTLDIEITSQNNTLSGIRDAINQAADGTGVSATIVNADDGAHLVLSATETGAASALSITTTGGDGGLTALTNANMTELTAATDAQVEVDGLLRTSASNSITDMLDGITLTLTEAAPGTVQELTVTGDPSVLREAADSFVTAYNSALDAIASTTSYDTETRIGAPLNGDSMVRGVTRDFRDAISDAIVDLKTLGITADKEGKLTLDAAVFDAAMATDPAPAARLFSGDGSLTASLELTLDRLLDDDGTLTQRTEGLEERSSSIDDQRIDLDRRMSDVEARYRAQFTALDILVSKMQSTSSFLARQLDNLPGFS